MAMKMISITDIDGFKLGNAENREKGTGCTVIISEEGAVGGVDVRHFIVGPIALRSGHEAVRVPAPRQGAVGFADLIAGRRRRDVE